MSIGVKLFIQTFLIVLIVIVSGSFVYLKSLDALFDNKVEQDKIRDVATLKSYFQNISSNLSTMSDAIASDESIQASINLISKYEDSKNYRAIIFDNEKRQLLRNLDKWIGTTNSKEISFYNDRGQFIASKGKEEQKYLSWDDGVPQFVSGDSIQTIEDLPIVDISKLGKVSAFVDQDRYVLRVVQRVGSTLNEFGYLKLEYHLSKLDIGYLEQSLINGVYFQTANGLVIALEEISRGLLQPSSQRVPVYNEGMRLYASFIVDTSFLEKQKKEIINTFILMAIVVSIVAFLIAWYFSKYLVVDRLVNLKESIESIKHGNYKKIDNLSNDELGKIIDDFNEIFDKLSQNYSFLESYQKSVDTANIVSTTDVHGRITYINDEFVRISGFTKEELLGKSHSIVRHPDMPKEVFQDLWKTILSGKVWRGVVKNRTKTGGSYWADSVISPVFDAVGNIKEFISIRRDITELVEQKEKMQKIADFDLTTGLGSRSKLQRDIQIAKNPAVAVININRFSQINDFYGHRFGDIVLKKVAKRLQKVAKENFGSEVMLYRPSGDEYVLLAHDNEGEFSQKIEKVLQSIEEETIKVGEEEVGINVSCGVSFEKRDLILLSADMALKISKKENKTLTIYSKDNSLNEVYQNNIEWTKKLKEAIAQDRIVPFFQPIVNNQTQKTQKYEALIRMIDNDGKIISPFFFLDIAKQTKQYARLTMIMLDKTFETFATKEESFSINLTAEDILNPQVVEHILTLLKQYPNIGERVVFEIVESESIESYDEVVDFIDRVKEQGCKIAIDDFGTGYSNFEYLIKLKADFIKIDGSLIKHIASSKESFVVISVIVSFAKQMGIKTVAEFVENSEIYEELQKLGVDYSQGYHFSPPLQTLFCHSEPSLLSS